MTDTNAPFRVLSIDGGGMRGLYTVAMLDSLARLFGRPRGYDQLDVGKGFDLITGTSTGGIIACGLAAGISTARMMQFYKEDGPKIFHSPAPNGKGSNLCWAWKHRKTAANDVAPLRNALTRIFHDRTLKQLYDDRNIALCIPAVTMSNHQSRVFKTPHLQQFQLDNNQKVVDICLATSAAPIVLPLASLPDPDVNNHVMTYADGGLWANNPVLVGLIEALEIAGQNQPIQILSISTCAPPAGEDIAASEANWGIKQWKVGINALETALDAQSSGYNFMAQKLIRYLNRDCQIVRLPPSPPPQNAVEHIGIDKAGDTAIRVLTALGQEDAKNARSQAMLNESSDNKCLIDIFSTMPPLQAGEH